MKKLIYKYSGAQYLIESMQAASLRYRLRLRMAPASFILFIWMLGTIAGGASVYLGTVGLTEWHLAIAEKPVSSIVLVNDALAIEKPAETKIDTIQELSELIWTRESSKGKNNFSQCEKIGKVNGIGYAIPGDGSFVCFDSHAEEMEVLRGWLIAKRAAGMSDAKMLCLYSGNNYDECTK